MKRIGILLIAALGLMFPGCAAMRTPITEVFHPTVLPTNQDGVSYKVHRVKWMETLYSISRKYGVDALEIAKFNNLRDAELTRGMKLLIPLPAGQEKLLEDPHSPWNEDAEAPEEAQNPEEPYVSQAASLPCHLYHPTPLAHHRVSLLLPLSQPQTGKEFISFYQGALIAVQQLKEQGLNATIECFDWSEETDKDALLSSEALQQSDLVIGPVMASDIGTALTYLEGTQANLVSPLDRNANRWLPNSPRFFQVQANREEAQFEALSALLQADQATIWVISEEGETQVTAQVHQALQQRHIPFRQMAYNVLEGREVPDLLLPEMSEQGRMQVIVASQNEAFVSDAIRNLYLLNAYHSIPIELFGLSGWHHFETLDLAAVHRLQMVIPSPFYVDYTQPEVIRFVATFRGLYGSEPNPYAFQGYDVVYYFLNALYRMGPNFKDCLPARPASMLQMEMAFRKSNLYNEESGYSNCSIRLIKYLPNYSIDVVQYR